MPYKNSEELKKKVFEQTLQKIEKRKHFYVEGQYESKQSLLIIWCPRHFNEHVTTFSNYNRSGTGCPCCGKEQVSKKLKNRQYSDETLQRMSKAALERGSRGGKPRKWRKESKYLKWRELVFKRYNFKCVVTGIQKKNFIPSAPFGESLVVHHLNGANSHQHLVYVVENGVVLTKELHLLFHNQYGYRNNTLFQFQSFLLSLLKTQESISTPISSQANSEELEGSETRAYDPDRVKELHECLGKISLLPCLQSYP
uniref:Putative site-specific DNA endonuclease n=1 Tax=Tupiella akineta TaxID=160070 RepID=Q3ZJ53_TUPAK|nr:putative site-specific DNA endonuclease [Tupiella akineta]AAV80638.1 putative site-specific DNA endonuclease [Tupiella akineta]